MEKNNNKRADERNGSVVILQPAGSQFPMVKKTTLLTFNDILPQGNTTFDFLRLAPLF